MDLSYPAGDQGVPERSREPAEEFGEFQVGGDREQDQGQQGSGRIGGGDFEVVRGWVKSVSIKNTIKIATLAPEKININGFQDYSQKKRQNN